MYRTQEKKSESAILDEIDHKTITIHKNEKTRHCNRKSGNLQARRKQDTYYLGIKEDLSKFYSFSLKKSLFLVQKKEKKQQIG